MEKTVTTGHALIAQKASLGHGEWLPWVEANLPIKNHMVQNLIKLAEANTHSTADFNSVDDALAANSGQICGWTHRKYLMSPD